VCSVWFFDQVRFLANIRFSTLAYHQGETLFMEAMKAYKEREPAAFAAKWELMSV
jgi:hypothetical protein